MPERPAITYFTACISINPKIEALPPLSHGPWLLSHPRGKLIGVVRSMPFLRRSFETLQAPMCLESSHLAVKIDFACDSGGSLHPGPLLTVFKAGTLTRKPSSITVQCLQQSFPCDGSCSAPFLGTRAPYDAFLKLPLVLESPLLEAFFSVLCASARGYCKAYYWA